MTSTSSIAKTPAFATLSTWHWTLIAAGILAAQAAILYAMGRVPICRCGYVKVWHGVVNSSENSQHLTDWYTLRTSSTASSFTRLWLVPRLAGAAGSSLLAEGGVGDPREHACIINRYRAATISLDYFGDSIINSISDYRRDDDRVPDCETRTWTYRDAPRHRNRAGCGHSRQPDAEHHDADSPVRGHQGVAERAADHLSCPSARLALATFETYLGNMTDFSPREIVSELDRYIVGQYDAERAVAIALRNRWRRLQLGDNLREEVLPKNILMIGPTGVGKTELRGGSRSSQTHRSSKSRRPNSPKSAMSAVTSS